MHLPLHDSAAPVSHPSSFNFADADRRQRLPCQRTPGFCCASSAASRVREDFPSNHQHGYQGSCSRSWVADAQGQGQGPWSYGIFKNQWKHGSLGRGRSFESNVHNFHMTDEIPRTTMRGPRPTQRHPRQFGLGSGSSSGCQLLRTTLRIAVAGLQGRVRRSGENL